KGYLSEPSTQNSYIYAINNPVSFIDPDGEMAKHVQTETAGFGGSAMGRTIRVPKAKVQKAQNKGTSKAINLPSYKKVSIDMGHIMSGHSKAGGRAAQSGMKDLFPSNMSQKQIENAIRNAYQHGKKVKTQGDRVKVQGKSGGITIEMWVNTKTKVIETAYPKF
ncbi:hypothetical protein GJU40_12900, partial [Bacillus lacus]